MEKMSFRHKLECVSLAWVSVLVNGSLIKDFKMFKRLRELVDALTSGVLRSLSLDFASHICILQMISYYFLRQKRIRLCGKVVPEFLELVSESKAIVVASIISCELGRFPLAYLGISMGANSRRISTWEPIIEKVRQRLVLWQ
ncbi:Retrovirus-related Pol polyprotein LINE-1 [Gossypium australe]|uniref:Retrovirus-related Pol polyprotein LINE-1 n=1 Tax=Gossypium australe TaxID=47621 RepID=A0A5B6WQ33_9ROSI|nr:Retrovirus-related Pol polyprotein LINE-1 [Gossypium australe]